MKKKTLLLIAALSATISSIECATVRIKNNSKAPIWARINENQMMTHKDIVHRVSAGVSSLGLTETINKDLYKKMMFPDFKKIESTKLTFFNSNFDPINKISFIQNTKNEKITLKYNENSEQLVKSLLTALSNRFLTLAIDPKIQYLNNGKKITFPNSNDYQSDAASSQEGSNTALTPSDEQRYKEDIEKLKSQATEIQLTMPTLVETTVNPNIDALTVESRIEFNGPDNVIYMKKRNIFASPQPNRLRAISREIKLGDMSKVQVIK